MSEYLSTEEINNYYIKLKHEIGKVVIGQEHIIEQVVICLFAGGHVLVEGVPGLAKTLIASSLSYIVNSCFKRVQFTPDLMPADIIGTTIFNSETNQFTVKKGPVFTNILLADEINRAPSKTQSALLQAMQEKEVTIDGTGYPLGEFFICLATQNPIEMEGTYPLPEAQVDRFLMKVLIDYPSRDEENKILTNYREGFSDRDLGKSDITHVLDESVVAQIKKGVDRVIVDDQIINYITGIIAKTRDFSGIFTGASPRGSVALFQAARVKAVLEGRDFVIPDDVKFLASPVLRHRIILEPEAELEGFSPDSYIEKILEEVEVPR